MTTPERTEPDPEGTVVPDREPAPQTAKHVDVGERVAGILQAAEDAADRIRADALAEANASKEEIEREARARADELVLEAERVRKEADDYASRRHSEAEERARTLVSEAETRALAVRETARETSKQIEFAALQRQAKIQEQARSFEERMQRALGSLRELIGEATDLQNLLEETPKDGEGEALSTALDPKSRNRAPNTPSGGK